MKTHPYLRAFVSGIFVPTLILPLMLMGFITFRLLIGIELPIERIIIFPMAVVPFLWGLWNMLYLATHERTHLVIGVHGACLPILGAPTGALVASSIGILQLQSNGILWFHVFHIPYALIGCVFLTVLVLYYLLWKYVVGFVNRVLEIG